MKKSKIVLSILISLCIISTTWAKDKKAPLVSNMEVYVVKTDTQGKENLQPAKETDPGDMLEYNLIYTNQMEKPLSGLIVSGPIPTNTVYISESAKTDVLAELVVSIDGGATFEPEPVKRKQKKADGTMETVIIPPKKYTNVRWKAKQPIESLGKQLYSYRVRVK